MAPGADDQRRLIRSAQENAGLSTGELWLRYFALGGTASLAELEAFLAAAVELDAEQRDRVALAVNEHLDSLATHRAPYSRPMRDADATDGALGALVVLLQRTHLAPPEAVPRAADLAAARLHLRAVVYVVDDAAESLVPLPGRHAGGREVLGVDGTVAGRAYRTLLVQPTVSPDGQARLWVPIIDGVSRVGVLDVMVRDADDLEDATLRRQAWWIAHFLGHLIVALDRYGDATELARRNRARSVEAELVWQLLPPLTAGTDRVLVSGRVEPAADIGGDVFDYALSDDRAWFAVVDAQGHDLRSGLAAASAVSACRQARRTGRGLVAQAEAMHDVLGTGPAVAYATAVLGDLDLRTGRLRYLAAGHPYPMLVRHGRVVRELTGGRRALLGLDARSVEVGEEQLEPDDMVAVYTDGFTEARDPDRQAFGRDRLVDVLQRQCDVGAPLPEIARRCVKAVLHHQRGVLQDDATLLLVHWTSEGQRRFRPLGLRF